jgi:hypothetical protein
VANVSTVRKLGVVARVAAQQAGRNRTVGALWRACQASFTSFGRVLHQLWLEVTGFVFLVLAIVGGLALAHEYTQYRAGIVGLRRVIMAICFTLLFAWFGVTSFWRVRRKH